MKFLNNLFRKRGEEGTEEVVTFYRRAVKAARYTGTLPYDWNPQTLELEFSKSRLLCAIFVSQYLMHILYEGFVIYRWIYAAYLDSNATAKNIATLEYATIAYGIPVMNQSCYFLNRHNLHNFINRLLHYVRHDFQNDGRKLQKVGKILRIAAFVASLVISLNVSSVFRRPESAHLLSSLVPEVTKRAKWELIPFALIHSYIWCSQWVSFYFTSTLYMAHISAMGNALNRTRPHRQLTAERFFRATRKLEVLQGNFNAIMRWAVWAGMVFLVTLVVYGICGSIWNEGAQAVRFFVVAMCSMALMLTSIKGLGSVFETSREILSEWSTVDEPSLLFRKQMKSMRAIRVQVGGYFYVDAAMTLTLLGILSENTFNVLLAA